MGPRDPMWDPKNSGCLAVTQRGGGELRIFVSGKPRAIVSCSSIQRSSRRCSGTLTLDTYSHDLPGMQEESAARLNALLAGR